MTSTTTLTERETAHSHVVLRPFFGGGEARVVGEVVDANAWRSAERLCEQRYLRPMLHEDPDPVTDGERFFIDDDSLLAFIDQMPATEDDVTEDDVVAIDPMIAATPDTDDDALTGEEG